MARKISTVVKMSFEEFKTTFGKHINMTEGAKKDQFLVAEWKRNMKEIAENEEKIAKAKLELEEEIAGIESTLGGDKLIIKASDEEQE